MGERSRKGDKDSVRDRRNSQLVRNVQSLFEGKLSPIIVEELLKLHNFDPQKAYPMLRKLSEQEKVKLNKDKGKAQGNFAKQRSKSRERSQENKPQWKKQGGNKGYPSLFSTSPNAGRLQEDFDLISMHKDPLERVLQYSKLGVRVLVLMRGPPGSGKTTLAKTVLTKLGLPREEHLYSADDYFINQKGIYCFKPDEVGKAHQWVQAQVSTAVALGVSPIIVDNTNTRLWEMKPYAVVAVETGYVLEVLVPQNPFFRNAEHLSKNNSHNVPKVVIKQMLERYETGLTGQRIIKNLNLEYSPDKTPPKLALKPSKTRAWSPNISRSRERLNEKNSEERGSSSPTQEKRCATPRQQRPLASRQQHAAIPSNQRPVTPSHQRPHPPAPQPQSHYLAYPPSVYNYPAPGPVLGNTPWHYMVPPPPPPPPPPHPHPQFYFQYPQCKVPPQGAFCPPLDLSSLGSVPGKPCDTSNDSPSVSSKSSSILNLMDLDLGLEGSDVIPSLIDLTSPLMEPLKVLEGNKNNQKKKNRKKKKMIQEYVLVREDKSILFQREHIGVANTLDEFRAGVNVVSEECNSKDAGSETSQCNTSQDTETSQLECMESDNCKTESSKETNQKASCIDQLKKFWENTTKETKNTTNEVPVPLPQREVVGSTEINREEKKTVTGRPQIIAEFNRMVASTSKNQEGKNYEKQEGIASIGEKLRNLEVKDKNGEPYKKVDNLAAQIIELKKQEADKSSKTRGIGQNIWEVNPTETWKFKQNDQTKPMSSKESALDPWRDLRSLKVDIEKWEDNKDDTPSKEVAETATSTPKPQRLNYIDASTITYCKDFEAVSRVENGEVGTSDLRIVNRSMTGFVPQRPILGRAVLSNGHEKGVMTEDPHPLKPERSKTALARLMKMFTKVNADSLNDLLEKCQEDIDWVANILLDSGHEISESYVPEVDVEEDEDIEEEETGETFAAKVEPAPAEEEVASSFDLGPHQNEIDSEIMAQIKAIEEALKADEEAIKADEAATNGLIEEENIEESSIEETKDNSDDEEIGLTISNYFIQQLQAKFGSLMDPLGEELVVHLPMGLARQLHSYVMDALYQQLEAQEDFIQSMMKQDVMYDEMLARKLQEEEDGGPDLKQIMDNEKALALIRASNRDKNNSESMASRMSRELLAKRFPKVDERVLKEILEDTGHSLFNATAVLTSAGHVPILDPQEDECKSCPSNEVLLTREEALEQAKAYREVCSNLYKRRKEHFAKAQKAFNQGQASVASFYSHLARSDMKQIEEANLLAATSLLSGNNISNITTLDLHFLQVKEAVDVLDLFVDAHVRGLGRDRHKQLYIITGRGVHSSNGRPKVRPAVAQRLVQRNIKFSMENPGLVKAMIQQSTLLTCDH